MGTKLQAVEDPGSCLNKADADEPVFILRAKDPVAPMVVRLWASLSQQLQAHEKHKASGAYLVATEMEAWAEKQYGTPSLDWKR